MRHALVALAIGLASFALSFRSGADESTKRITGTQSIPAYRFLPADAVAAYTADGSDAHQPAVKLTAAWKALEDTQYMARVLDLLQMFVETSGEMNGIVLRQLIDHVRANGTSAALAIRGSESGLPFPDSPTVVAVLHNADKFTPLVGSIVRTALSQQNIQVIERRIGTRKISTAVFPAVLPVAPLEFSWWSEGGHFVLSAGVAAADRVTETVDGKAPNISSHASWKQLRTADDFTVTEFGWLDLAWLMQKYANIPLPPSPSGNDVKPADFFRLAGMDGLKDVTLQGGIQDAETWSRMRLNGKLSETGLLSLWLPHRELTLAELPPLPKGTNDLMAGTFDISKTLAAGLQQLEQFFSEFDPGSVEDMKQSLGIVSAVLGSDLPTATAGFGDVWCAWFDTSPLPIPGLVAPVVAVSVRDRAAIDQLLQRAQLLLQPLLGAEGGSIRKSSRDGNDFYSVQFPPNIVPAALPVVPTILLTDKWLVTSITPAAAQTFAQRAAGKLAAWEPGPLVEQALAEVPKTWSSISISDPAPFYASTLQLAPTALMTLQNQNLPIFDGPIQLPFELEDLPAAELITEHLFPNVTTASRTADGYVRTTRQSVPSTPIGNVNATFTVPVLVALLLPAVQQAREAARRTQSKNNLKQLAIALHNYHDVYNHMPVGTEPNPELDPEERLSWAWSILPFIEYATVYNGMDKSAAWDAPANRAGIEAAIPVFQNPSQTGIRRNPSSSDYIGIAGVGADAAMLTAGHPRAGMFGYDRKVSFRSIIDGVSNTLMIGDSSTPNVSAFAGGAESIRGFSQSPYLNGPDGIGSPHAGVVQFALGDGSVRAISVDVDEKILEALATIAGGEVVGDY
ncbi:MAG: DUF1559 domain-containing protein [Planctomycetota bacterium]